MKSSIQELDLEGKTRAGKNSLAYRRGYTDPIQELGVVKETRVRKKEQANRRKNTMKSLPRPFIIILKLAGHNRKKVNLQVT